MTLNDKLDLFYTAVIDSATSQSVEIVEECKKNLQKVYDERKQLAMNKAENAYRIEADLILREKNRKLSKELMDMKRKLLETTALYTEQIFHKVRSRLEEFMKTPSYSEYLCLKIREARAFAREDAIIIYINPSDEQLKSSLEAATGVELTISDRDFIGGIRAVISVRSILIDHSFLTKLSEEKASFKL